MAATTKKTTKKTGNNKPATKEKLSKAAQWRRANPNGIMEVNDPAVLYGLSVYEIYN
jgi:hypothetical protein